MMALPALPLPSAQISAAIAEIGGALGIDILNPKSTDWMFYATGAVYADGSRSSPLIVPDTVLSFEYRGESRVSDYPIEKGSFASYNKVTTPYDIQLVMVCAGGRIQSKIQDGAQKLGLNLGPKYMQKQDFIAVLDYMLKKTILVDIVTPDKTYESSSLVNYDYKRETKNGATLLIVAARFREIRVVKAESYTNSASPSAADPVSNGTVNPGYSLTVTVGGDAEFQ